MKYTFIYLLLTIFVPISYSQIYIPIDTTNISIKTASSENYKVVSKNYLKSVSKTLSFKEKKLLKKRFKGFDKRFFDDIDSGLYVFDSRFEKIITKIITEITLKNPIVPSDLSFFVSRDNTLNASSVGNKCVIINLGSFYYLQNIDQLASIIAHEISHFLLNHMIKDMQHLYSLGMNSSNKNEIAAIMNEKYNRGDIASSKLKNIVYDISSSYRKDEYEADSLGYLLIKNTNFNHSDFINSFKLCEAYDTIQPIGLKYEMYKKLFDLPNQPFEEQWMKMDDFSAYDYSKFKEKYNEDSLKYHPETDERIKNLKMKFPELNVDGAVAEADSVFKELQNTVKFEQPNSLFLEKEYGVGIYLCLYRIQNEDHSHYYKEWLGRFFEKIYEARKSYTLNRYLERLEPKHQSESYQQFLSFMWNLNLVEIKTIAEHYNIKGSK